MFISIISNKSTFHEKHTDMNHRNIHLCGIVKETNHFIRAYNTEMSVCSVFIISMSI